LEIAFLRTYFLTPLPTYATSSNHLNKLIGVHQGIIPLEFGHISISSSGEVVRSFPYINQCIIVTQGHNLNKIGRRPLDDVVTKYESSGPCSIGQEDVWKLHFENLFFWPRDLLMQPIRTVVTNLVGYYRGIIPNEFGQIPLPVLEKKSFEVFLIKFNVILWPPDWVNFDPRCIIWTTLVEDLLMMLYSKSPLNRILSIPESPWNRTISSVPNFSLLFLMW